MCVCNYVNTKEEFCESEACQKYKKAGLREFGQFITKKYSRFEDIPLQHLCISIFHNPPHVIVPYGKVYIHVCELCGKETRINSSNISC